MATTSLWHIEGRLKDLIDYVENPEKTAAKTPELQDLYNVFSYVQRPEATQEGEYVTAINCLKETALRQMILTKKRYGKTDGYIAWHGYQSFKPEEVTPQLAHEIGVKLAKEMWGDRFEIIVTTHLDKEHLHCHFCFNSVSYRDGGKYNYSKAEQQRLREASDRLCREYGLSVIEKPRKAPSRPVWLDEKSGKPTRYNVYRADVQEAMDYIGKSCKDPGLSVGQVAAGLGLSEGHLSHLFKKETGLTVGSYLTRCRMQKAMALLKEGKLRVYEVAEAVGYKDITYFSGTFKKLTGMSPTEYQNASF